jgi:hypothetical protein
MTNTPRFIEHAFALKQIPSNPIHEKNSRQINWFCAVYDCATPNPRLVCVQDPFGNLLAKAKGSVLISAAQVLEATTDTN